ncbi:MAG: type II CAAX endopeptidase family protein [Candidatus Omnitrophica bacterium]|nr:type II CAAX endopeptidase family protein [Candidatus Omnitrophota bacterium]
MNKNFIFIREILIENKLYVWLLAFILSLSILSYIDKGFFSCDDDIRQLKEASLHFEKISPGDIMGKLHANKGLSQIFGMTFLAFVSMLLYGIYLSPRILPGIMKLNSCSLGRLNRISWTTQDVFRAAIIILFFSKLLYIAELFFLKTIGIVSLNIFVRSVYRSFLLDSIAVLTVFYFVVRKYNSSLRSLGIKLGNLYANFVFGALHYIGFIPYLLVAIIISLYFSGLFNYDSQPLFVFSIFFENQPKSLIIFFSFFVSLFAPIVEEIFFRGFFYSALRARTGPLRAAFFVSFIFALLHMNMTGFFPIFILGLLLAYLYEKTDSLIAPITVHILHNSIVLYFVFLYRALVLT